MKKDKRIHSTISATMLLTLCGVIQKGIAFVTVPIYTRIMPPIDYGRYSVFLSWYQIIMIITTLNMWNYLMNNGMVEFHEKKDDFIASLQGLSSVITFFWFFIYLFISEKWEHLTGLSVPVMMLMFLELMLMPSFEYWCSAQRFQYKTVGVVILTILQALLMPIITIPLIVYSSDKGFAAITGRVISYSIVYAFGFFLILRKSRHWVNFNYWRYSLNFSLPLVPHFLSMIILQQSDRIMIERMCGEADAAKYSVAYQASSALLVINHALLSVLVPYIYKALRNKEEKRIKKRVVPILMLIGIINLFASLLAPEIIKILAPNEYYNAVYVIPPVMLSNLFMLLFNLFATIEYYYKQTKYVACASIISAIVNILLNYLFINAYGFIAAGYTTVICYLLFSLCHNQFMNKTLRKFNVETSIYDLKSIWLIVIVFSFSIMLIIPLYIYRMVYIRYAIVAGILIIMVLRHKKVIRVVSDCIR